MCALLSLASVTRAEDGNRQKCVSSANLGCVELLGVHTILFLHGFGTVYYRGACCGIILLYTPKIFHSFWPVVRQEV